MEVIVSTKIKYLLFVFISVIIISCTEKEIEESGNSDEKTEQEQESNTFKFDFVSYFDTLGNCDETGCVVIDIKYSFIKECPPGINKDQINTIVKKQALTDSYSGRVYDSPKQIGDTLLSDAVYDTKDRGYPVKYDIQREITLDTTFNKILVVKSNLYEYTGGAHGMPSFNFKNYIVETGKEISLYDVIQQKETEAFLDSAEVVLRESMMIPEGEPLNDFGYYLENGELVLPENFIIKQNGISLFYNVYEIAPYAQGFTEIDLPFKKVNKYLTPEFKKIIN